MQRVPSRNKALVGISFDVGPNKHVPSTIGDGQLYSQLQPRAQEGQGDGREQVEAELREVTWRPAK